MEHEATNDGNGTRFLRILAGLLLVLALVRLLAFAYTFTFATVQMDFAAFYTAGKSVQNGLSPYVNYVDYVPPIWDGTAGYSHSRYLYPPPSAHFFQPLAWLGFVQAKTVWTVLALVALGLGLMLAMKQLMLQGRRGTWMVSALVAALSYPVLTLLERGQIDSVTLWILLGAITVLRTPRGELIGGGLVALASVFKPNCLYLLGFALLRGRWRMVAGCVAGGLLLGGIALVLDGPSAVSSYLGEDLPRIARYGEGGPDDARLPRYSFSNVAADIQAGNTVVDGMRFRRTYFRFVLNGTLVQTDLGQRITEASGGRLTPSVLSVMLLVLGLGVTLAWLRLYGPPGTSDDDTAGDFLYWQLALGWILLCGPVTWVMTTVWLLPMTPLLIREAELASSRAHRIWLLVASAGLLLVVMPDGYGNYMLMPADFHSLANYKYVLGELLAVIGLFGMWRARSLAARQAA